MSEPNDQDQQQRLDQNEANAEEKKARKLSNELKITKEKYNQINADLKDTLDKYHKLNEEHKRTKEKYKKINTELKKIAEKLEPEERGKERPDSTRTERPRKRYDSPRTERPRERDDSQRTERPRERYDSPRTERPRERDDSQRTERPRERYDSPRTERPRERYDSPRTQRPRERYDSPRTQRPRERYDSPRTGRPRERPDSPRTGRPRDRYDSPRTGRPRDRYDSPRTGRPRDRYDSPRTGRPRDRYDSPRTGRPRDEYDSPRTGRPSDRYDSPRTGRERERDSPPTKFKDTIEKDKPPKPDAELKKDNKEKPSTEGKVDEKPAGGGDDDKEAAHKKIKKALFKEVEDDLDPYENAFNKTGVGKFSYLVLVATCLIHNYVVIEMFAIMYVISPAECDLNLQVYQLSLCMSAVFIGILCSGFFWGRISDIYGRRIIILPCVYAAILMSFISSFATKFSVFFTFRFFTGIFIGAPNAITFVYLGEMQIAAFRDLAIGFLIASGQFTCVLLPALAWLIIPNSWSFRLGSILIRPWRFYMWTWTVMGLIGAAILCRLPESPKFVLIRKSPEKALAILQKIYATNHGGIAVDYPVQSLAPKDEHKSNLSKDFAELVKRPMFRCLMLLNSGIFITYLLAFGLYIWLPDVLNEALKAANETESVCEMIHRRILITEDEFAEFQTDPSDGVNSDDCLEGEVNMFVYPMQIVLETLNLIPFILLCIYMHKVKKILVYAIILVVNAVALLFSSFIPQVAVATILFIIGVSGASAICIISALAVQAFPTSLRGLAVSVMYSCGFLGAILGANLMPILYSPFCYIIFVLLAFFALASASSLMYLWPNLDDVRAQMESRHFTY